MPTLLFQADVWVTAKGPAGDAGPLPEHSSCTRPCPPAAPQHHAVGAQPPTGTSRDHRRLLVAAVPSGAAPPGLATGAVRGCSCSLQPHVPAAPGGGLRASLPPSRPEPTLPAPSSLFRSHGLTCCYPRAVCGGFPKPSSVGIYGEPEGKAKESLLKRSLDIS